MEIIAERSNGNWPTRILESLIAINRLLIVAFVHSLITVVRAAEMTVSASMADMCGDRQRALISVGSHFSIIRYNDRTNMDMLQMEPSLHGPRGSFRDSFLSSVFSMETCSTSSRNESISDRGTHSIRAYPSNIKIGN